MSGVNSLHAMVGVYRIDAYEKKFCWPHYINTKDVLKYAVFKVFKLFNPDVKVNFLSFTRRTVMHYLPN